MTMRKVTLTEFALVYAKLVHLLGGQQNIVIPSSTHSFRLLGSQEEILKVVYGLSNKYYINDRLVQQLVDDGVLLDLEWTNESEALYVQ